MKTFACLFSAMVFLLMPRTGAAATPPVYISEIMYHPPGTNHLEQWFELYNAGGKTADLTGWRVTKGVQFGFPAGTRISPGSYLAVAADQATFTANHPGVNNFVAGWSGKLGHVLEISDGSGKVINSVEFYSQGDWATRMLGPVQYNHQGWVWRTTADGEGASLELINPALPNSFAHNWAPNRNNSGTPGAPNSVETNDAAPFISGVTHWPKIPRPADTVWINARITDENVAATAVALHWRVDGQNTFNAVAMLDDGAHQDGIARDGIFGTSIPPQPDHTVIEFCITASDAAGYLRKYPEFIAPENSPRTANLLYQVEGAADANSQPVYRIVMTEAERAELHALGRNCPDSDSDAEMNATWITEDGVIDHGTSTQVRYNAGVRNRGHGTRQSDPNNYHVNIPEDRPWKKQTGINLNSQYAYSQVIGSAVLRAAGIVIPNSRAVQVRVNSTNLMSLPLKDNNSFGSYAANEQYNNDFIQRSFPLDSAGNAYRGIRDQVLCDRTLSGVADLTWHGADWAVPAYTNAYFKQNNFAANDWSDLIRLIGVLNVTNGTTPSTYVSDIKSTINVEQWMRYMAADTLLANEETALANGTGDDYGLCRGTIDTRFQALPYDIDSVLGRGLTAVSPRNGIFRMSALPVLERLVKTPEFAPIYFAQLKDLADTVFSTERINPLIDQLLGGWVPPDVIDTMKAFNASQRSYVLSQIPLELTAATALPKVSGFYKATTPGATITGSGNAIDTRAIDVNGRTADWVAWQGQWTITLPLNPGINRITVRELGTNNLETAHASLDIWYDDGSVEPAPAVITSNTRWTAAGGPYQISSSMTVNSGVTLEIDSGTTVYFASGASLLVANGGRLLAEGTAEAPIRFTRAPGSSATWGGIVVNGSAGSPEIRITHSIIGYNGSTAIHSSSGTLLLDSLQFDTSDRQYVSLDSSSFVISHCSFPAPSASFEPAHGTGGVKPGGHGIFCRNFFGAANGYSDVVDFTGGQRGGPVIYFVDNVFAGSGDDCLDLDGTDAWIENNIFMHIHQNGSTDSSSAVSGGSDSGSTSEITVIGNLIFDCDQAATAKEGDFFTLLNNTIVHITSEGGTDVGFGVVNLRDTIPEITGIGKGFYLEGNVIADAAVLARNDDPAQTEVTFTNNILPRAWNGPGGDNYIGEPLLSHIPSVAEAQFSSWEQAQVMRKWFAPLPGSPARNTGPAGKDRGGAVPPGVYLTGVPQDTTSKDSALIHVGINRKGFGIPASGWPEGSGFIAYIWRLDRGEWSAETPITQPISLSALANGPHLLEVSGKTDAGLYENDPLFGDAASVASVAWTVDTNSAAPGTPSVYLNEILAGSRIQNSEDSSHDLVELYNFGSNAVSLGGLRIASKTNSLIWFAFPADTVLQPDSYIVLHADSDTGPGLHLGFKLDASGDSIVLISTNGTVLDRVAFGNQLPNLSIGRGPDGTWTLCEPAFGARNVPVKLAEPGSLRINEWLANVQYAARHSFVELYNPAALPAPLGGLYLSDAAGAPNRFRIPDLSFIGARGFATFVTDGDTAPGHADFKLSADVGQIQLANPSLAAIDLVSYGPQTTDLSQGRSPDGADRITIFSQPTPNAPNPRVSDSSAPALLMSEVFAGNIQDSSGNFGDWVEFYNPSTNRLDLSGISVTDDPGNPRRWVFAAGTFMGANSNFVVTFSAVLPVSTDNTGFALEKDGGTICVFDAPERGGALLDSIRYGIQIPSLSIGRVPNANGEWRLTTPTPGAPNSALPTGTAAALRINEWLASSSIGSDWFELYNPGSVPVSIAGLFLTDDLTDRSRFQLPPLSFIGTGTNAFLRFEADSAPEKGARHVDFNLSVNGEEIGLFDPLGVPIDSVVFGPQAPNISQGRLPDGSSLIVTLAALTPGASNSGTEPGDSDRDGLPDEWERAHFGSLARDGSGDFDGDGMSDSAEYRAGTNPADLTDALRLAARSASGGGITLEFRGVAGKSYHLEFKDDFNSAGWQPLRDIAAQSAADIQIAAPAEAAATRFYRVRVE